MLRKTSIFLAICVAAKQRNGGSLKKFVFTLASLLKIRETDRERLMAEYAEAETQFVLAKDKKAKLERQHIEECQSFERKCALGMKPSDMRDTANYLEELRGFIKLAAAAVIQAEKKVEEKRQELAGVYREIKTLEKLREKQYKEYLVENEKEEVKLREDILAFNITGKPNEENSANKD